MAPKIPFLKSRINLVEQKEKQFAKRLKLFREGLVNDLINQLLAEMSTTGGVIDNSIANLSLMNRIDRIYEQAINGTAGRTFTGKVAGDVDDIINLNKKYYTKIFPSKDITGTLQAAGDYTKTYLGVSTETRAVSSGSRILDAMKPGNWTSRIKAVLINSVENGLDTRVFRKAIERVGRDYDKEVMKKLPNIYDKTENVMGKQVASQEEMHFAYYQGGIMARTRDFCEVRNDQVFHISEIAKFGTSADEYGGYTNKSAGEFQGKTDLYDPFIDLGGYNCRHRYFYISNEMGLSLRPDLEGVDLPIPSNWVMA